MMTYPDGTLAADLFERHSDRIQHIASYHGTKAASQLGLPRDHKEDFEQDAYLEVWEKLPRYDNSRGSLRTFAERIVRNRMISIARARRARREVSFSPAALMGLTRLSYRHADIDLCRDVWRIVNSLSDQDRIICLLLMRYTSAEASRRAGIARSTLYLAIARIRACFVSAGFGPPEAREKLSRSEAR